jgi:serine/threonine protein kinase/Flp pilus assembly protein TadD
MTPERWRRIEELFRATLEREGSQQGAFLDEACAADPSLRGEVESLIASHQQMGGFLDKPVLADAPQLSTDEQTQFMVGRRIGSYRVIREIGHGGMGAVYLAIRADDEYRKQVAIKLVKRGMDTDFILRRFRHERQILADLDHPNIAKLLDGGTTEDGLPYFIMDHVDGVPINVFCDSHKLPTLERLKLFRVVLAAVHHAHQHDVVHRDLKPSNILVTADGVPKLLDFGIAKLVHPDPSSQTKETTSWLRPMTPDYASPEQVRGGTITPSSDLYSLGVLLYELLTGHHPYRTKSLTSQEIERVICEEEPEKPSAVIHRVEGVPGTDGEKPITITPESVSSTRHGQIEELRRHLAGDVDNILLMALRKEPERRYGSVEQFSEDICRHLEGLPVGASKDSLWYRSSKFIRRNRSSVIPAGLTATILILIGVGIYLLTGHSRIDSIAVLPFVNVRADPNTEYLSDGITETLMNKLSQLPNLRVISRSTVLRYKGKEQDPHAVGRTLKVQAVLTGKVVQTVDDLFISAELVDVQNNRHLWDDKYTRKLTEILVLQEEITRQISDQLRIRLTGEDKKRLNKRHTSNTEAYQLYLKGRYFWNKRTEKDMTKSIEYFQQAIEKDPNYALAYAGLADSYNMLARYDFLPPKEGFPRGKASALKALELDDTLTEAHTSLGHAQLFYDWDWFGAEREFRRAIELSPNYATAHFWYASYLSAIGRHDQAIPRIIRAQELDPLSLIINTIVGRTFYFARRYDQAIEQLRKTLELDPNFVQAHFHLGRAYVQKGMFEEAIPEFQKVIELTGDSPQAVAQLGYSFARSGKKPEARKLVDQLKELSTRGYVTNYHLAILYSGLGEIDQALECLEEASKERSSEIVFIKVSSEFDSLRSHPRFLDLLRRMGLAP